MKRLLLIPVQVACLVSALLFLGAVTLAARDRSPPAGEEFAWDERSEQEGGFEWDYGLRVCRGGGRVLASWSRLRWPAENGEIGYASWAHSRWRHRAIDPGYVAIFRRNPGTNTGVWQTNAAWQWDIDSSAPDHETRQAALLLPHWLAILATGLLPAAYVVASVARRVHARRSSSAGAAPPDDAARRPRPRVGAPAIASLAACVALAIFWARTRVLRDEIVFGVAGARCELHTCDGHVRWLVSERYPGTTEFRWVRWVAAGFREEGGSAFYHVDAEHCILGFGRGKSGYSVRLGPNGPDVPGETSITAIPLWAPTAAAAAWPAARILLLLAGARRSRHRRRNGLCPTCGYDLRCSPGRCPECGTVVGSR